MKANSTAKLEKQKRQLSTCQKPIELNEETKRSLNNVTISSSINTKENSSYLEQKSEMQRLFRQLGEFKYKTTTEFNQDIKKYQKLRDNLRSEFPNDIDSPKTVGDYYKKMLEDGLHTN